MVNRFQQNAQSNELQQDLIIPLTTAVYRNVDSIELTDKNYRVVNSFLDENQASVSVSGYETVIDLNLGGNINGMYWWREYSTLIVCSSGKVYACTYSPQSGSWTSTEISNGVVLDRVNIVSFAIGWTEAMLQYLCMANGGEIYTYYSNSGVMTFGKLDSGNSAPTHVDSLAGIDSYVLAHEVGTGRVWYSKAFYPRDWTDGGYFNASSEADNIVTIKVKNRQIYLLGTQTIEIWEDDGETPFSRIAGGFIQTGCISKDGIVERDDGLYFINSDRKFVRFSGSDIEYISTPYDKELESAENLTKTIASVIISKGKTFFSMMIPNYKTLLYNTLNDTWSEMGLYDSGVDDYTFLPIHSYIFLQEYGFNIVASYLESKVYLFDEAIKTYDGLPIRVLRTTGFIDYGTYDIKKSVRIMLKVKRGHTGEGVILIRWRENNGVWGVWHEIDIGGLGDTYPIARLHRTGMYKTRQYQVVSTAEADVIFLEGIERVQIIKR